MKQSEKGIVFIIENFHRSAIARSRALLLALMVALVALASTVAYLYIMPSQGTVSLSTFKVEGITIINSENNTTSLRGLVYVASTTAEQEQGFQNAMSFGNCNGFSMDVSTKCVGMIFVTSYSQSLCLWMHNTPIPLQQVWISSNGTVVDIYQAHPENNTAICHTALDVLETSPNASIAIGEEAELSGTLLPAAH